MRPVKTVRLSKSRVLLYLTLVLVMLISALQLDRPTKVKASGACCITGSQCTDRTAPKCCEPTSGEAWCSEAQHNYCRTNSCF